MGMRIDQAGYPGLDPAAGTTSSGSNTARRVDISSKPATPQLASVGSQSLAVADAFGMALPAIADEQHPQVIELVEIRIFNRQ
jgi:hypothetical protein